MLRWPFPDSDCGLEGAVLGGGVTRSTGFGSVLGCGRPRLPVRAGQRAMKSTITRPSSSPASSWRKWPALRMVGWLRARVPGRSFCRIGAIAPVIGALSLNASRTLLPFPRVDLRHVHFIVSAGCWGGRGPHAGRNSNRGEVETDRWLLPFQSIRQISAVAGPGSTNEKRTKAIWLPSGAQAGLKF